MELQKERLINSLFEGEFYIKKSTDTLLKNSLKRYGYRTISDLYKRQEELLSLRNCGRGSLFRLNELLVQNDYEPIDTIKRFLETPGKISVKTVSFKFIDGKLVDFRKNLTTDEINQIESVLDSEKPVYTLTNKDKDVEQLVVRYENAKMESKRLQRMGNSECRFEAGRAYALESVLRDIGLDYTDVASGRFY